MTELKTLKDFWKILPRDQSGFSNKVDVTCHSLRQEVIKLIKYWLNRKDKYALKHGQSIAQEFCKFFDVTDEDLK